MSKPYDSELLAEYLSGAGNPNPTKGPKILPVGDVKHTVIQPSLDRSLQLDVKASETIDSVVGKAINQFNSTLPEENRVKEGDKVSVVVVMKSGYQRYLGHMYDVLKVGEGVIPSDVREHAAWSGDWRARNPHRTKKTIAELAGLPPFTEVYVQISHHYSPLTHEGDTTYSDFLTGITVEAQAQVRRSETERINATTKPTTSDGDNSTNIPTQEPGPTSKSNAIAHSSPGNTRWAGFQDIIRKVETAERSGTSRLRRR